MVDKIGYWACDVGKGGGRSFADIVRKQVGWLLKHSPLQILLVFTILTLAGYPDLRRRREMTVCIISTSHMSPSRNILA